jgi:hypothetical protein
MALILESETRRGAIPNYDLEPGKSYIIRPPNRKKAVFIRKRVENPPFEFDPLNALSKVFAPRPGLRRARSVEYLKYIDAPRYLGKVIAKHVVDPQLERINPIPNVTHCSNCSPPATHTCTPVVEAKTTETTTTPPGSITTTTKSTATVPEVAMRHKCKICGKFRSAGYEARHPLATGEVPRAGICRRCRRSRTPSTESSDRRSKQRRPSRKNREEYRRRKTRQRPRRRYDSDDEHTTTASSSGEYYRHRTGKSASRSPSVVRKQSTRRALSVETVKVRRRARTYVERSRSRS